MSQWLLVNLPGMILNSMLESMVVTLVVYLLCAVFVFYRGKLGAKKWHLLALFFVVLFVQGLTSLVVQAFYPSPDDVDALTIARILVSPLIISALVLFLAKAWYRKSRYFDSEVAQT